MFVALYLLIFSGTVLWLDRREETQTALLLDILASFFVVVGFFIAGTDSDPFSFAAGLVHFLHILSIFEPTVIPTHWPSSLKIAYLGVAFFLAADGEIAAASLIFVGSVIFFIAHNVLKDTPVA